MKIIYERVNGIASKRKGYNPMRLLDFVNQAVGSKYRELFP